MLRYISIGNWPCTNFSAILRLPVVNKSRWHLLHYVMVLWLVGKILCVPESQWDNQLLILGVLCRMRCVLVSFRSIILVLCVINCRFCSKEFFLWMTIFGR